MNRFIKVIKDMDVIKVISGAPRNRKLPRSPNMAAMEKQTNTRVEPSRAVTMMAGSIMLTYCSKGPNPIPEK